MGQFKEIVWQCLTWEGGIDDLCNRRDEAERLLLEARKQLYPDLHGCGHSYGVGKFKEADRAFDIHQVARHALGDEREPWSLEDDLPSIKVVEKPDL